MAAAFVSLSSGESIFKSNFIANNVVSVDFLNSLMLNPKKASTIITDVSIDSEDTIQYILTFDDVVNWFHFGRGLGQINIRGMIFTDCDGKVPGLGLFHQAISRSRGKVVTISMGWITFDGLIQRFNTTLTADPAPVIEFSVSVTVISHSMPNNIVNAIC